mgnify:CR=1 FL=1
MVKILVHQSLTLTEKGEPNQLGLQLVETLAAQYPISDEKLYSDEAFLEDIRSSLRGNKPGIVRKLVESCCGEQLKGINRFPDKETIFLLWGSGEAHWVSPYISPRRIEYDKVVWDRHFDDAKINEQYIMMGHIPSREGAWLTAERRANKNLKHAETINRKTGIYTRCNKKIHVSVDLDIVSGFPALPCWQHDKAQDGYRDVRGLTLDQTVAQILSAIDDNTIRRFDIGGLHLPRDEELKDYKKPGIFDPRDPEAFRFAVECYDRILDIAYRKAMKQEGETVNFDT